MRTRVGFESWVALSVWAVLPVVASAQAPDAAADEAARQHYAVGEEDFSAGRYEAALQEFEQAYELSHRAALLYNIGLCNERLGPDAAALEAYERYLREEPNAPHRATVERRVEIQRERIAREAAPVVSGSGGIDVGPIIVGSLGGALLAGGAVLLGVGANDRSVISNAPLGEREWTAAERDLGTADLLTAVGAAAMGVGAIAIGAAIAWGTSQSSSVTVGIAPGGVVVAGSF